jgi:uncharacterized membrane protein YkoI
MTVVIESSGTATIKRILAGLLLLSSILASSDAIADLTTTSTGQLGRSGPAQQEKNAGPDERYIAQFRAAPLSLTQAIAVAERLHAGSRAAAVNFEISDRPGYRVRTVRNKQVWENVVDVITGRAIGLEAPLSMSDLEVDERDNIMALRSVGQELSEAVAIAEKVAAGKAISGGLVKEEDQVNFVVVVLSDGRVKEVFLEPPRCSSKNAISCKNGGS